MSNKGFAADGRSKRKFEEKILEMEKREHRNLVRKKRFARRRNFLRHEVIECVLFRNGVLFHTVRNMSAGEMARQNRIEVQKCNARADKNKSNKDPALWSWRIKDHDAFEVKLNEAANNF